MPPNSVLECDGLTITELSPPRLRNWAKICFFEALPLARLEDSSKLQFELSVKQGSQNFVLRD